MDRPFAFCDLSARIILRLPQVLLNNTHAFNQHPLLLRYDLKNLTTRTTEVPRDYLNVIAFFDVKLIAVHHSTSGARETIFIKFFSLSSRATGPKMRVPRGFKSLSIMTMALLSNRNKEPSSRFTGCLVRTITARTTSPFLTVPVALASLTLAVITSPIRA